MFAELTLAPPERPDEGHGAGPGREGRLEIRHPDAQSLGPFNWKNTTVRITMSLREGVRIEVLYDPRGLAVVPGIPGGQHHALMQSRVSSNGR